MSCCGTRNHQQRWPSEGLHGRSTSQLTQLGHGDGAGVSPWDIPVWHAGGTWKSYWEGKGSERLEQEKLAHGVGASKNKPSLLPPCHNMKCLAPGVSLPPEIMPGAATTLHGDALSMPSVSMATTRNVARVTGSRASWDLALKRRIWVCLVSFSFFPPPSRSSIFGFSSLPLLV